MQKKVVLAMSGGIDSSVSAHLLQEMGYEVIGVTFVMFDEPQKNDFKDFVNDAQIVASKLGIKHYTVDIKKVFKEKIINYFVEAYLNGRTPNPCTLCNPTIKWKSLIDFADSIDIEYVATGHYSILENENDRVFIKKAVDDWKDQTYFLWDLPQNYLKRSIFPLSELKKEKVREIAAELGFVNLVHKKESYDVCFIKNTDYRYFIDEYIKESNIIIKEGDFVTEDGKVVGKHKGITHYTVGQRKGLVAMGVPYFVKKIDKENNQIIIAPRENLNSKELYVKNYNSMKYDNFPTNKKFLTKIRFRGNGVLATTEKEGDLLKVIFDEPIFGVAPGQSAVFYEDDDLVGGGVII